MMTLLLTAGVKYSTVFNGFTNRAIWILIPALYFGFALSKTGLGKRLAYWIIGLFRPSYFTLTISWVIIGVVLSAFTPSITVRIAILIPIAVSITEICKLRGGSEGASFILLVAWSMALLPGSGWLTGSLWGPLGMGFFDVVPGLQDVINFQSWARAFLVPTVVLSVLFIVMLFKAMKPHERLSVDRDAFKAESRLMGPMSFHEKVTLTVLTLTFLMFVTGPWHHVPDMAIGLGAFFMLAVFGVIGIRDIGPGISWNLVLFLGAVFGLGAVFSETGVTSFLSSVSVPMVSRLAVNPWLFVYVVGIVLFAWRFLDVAQLTLTIPIILPVFPIIAKDFGIHPLVGFTLVVMAGNCFFFSYQQPFVILAEALSEKAKWVPAQLAKAGIIYFVACLITLAITIPYWKAVGLLG